MQGTVHKVARPLFQSTRPARGATDSARRYKRLLTAFQSTRPARGATNVSICQRMSWRVSIHAPRAGRDMRVERQLWVRLSFNPRAPRGARPLTIAITGNLLAFQSTRPARGATLTDLLHAHHLHVSIHAPRAGRDLTTSTRTQCGSCFNPRAPRGARLGRVVVFIPALLVSIHAPRAGRDARAPDAIITLTGFNPRAPRGARRMRGPRRGWLV